MQTVMYIDALNPPFPIPTTQTWEKTLEKHKGYYPASKIHTIANRNTKVR